MYVISVINYNLNIFLIFQYTQRKQQITQLMKQSNYLLKQKTQRHYNHNQISSDRYQENKQNNNFISHFLIPTLPNNPLNKKQFLKKSRNKSLKDSEHDSYTQVPRVHQTQNSNSKYNESNSKRNKNLKEYLIQDLTEKKIDQNNKLFSQIIEYIVKIKNKINDEIKSSTTSHKQSFSPSQKYISKNSNTYNKQLILSNIKGYFDQIFLITNHTDPKQYPNHIETIIQFQTIENINIEQADPKSKDISRQSNLSYFKKNLINPQNIINENSHKYGKNSQASYDKSRDRDKRSEKSYQNTMKTLISENNFQKDIENKKKTSIYEKVLQQRKSKAKKTKK